MKKKFISSSSPNGIKQLPNVINSQRLKKSPQSEANIIKLIESKESSFKKSPLNLFIEKPGVKSSLDLNCINSFLNEPSFFYDQGYENYKTRSPGGRKEVHQLMEWLDQMLQKVNQTRFEEPSELFDTANEIYSTCLAETIRQVSVHCKERGYLISRVWVAYKNLFEKALAISKTRYANLIHINSLEKFKMNQDYSVKIKNLNEMLNTNAHHRDQLIETINELENSLKDSKIKELKMIEKNNLIREKYKILRTELTQYREENRVLRIKFKNFTDEDFVYKKNSFVRKKFKVKKKKEIEKISEQDPLLNSFDDFMSENIASRFNSFGIL
jgi:Axonemal dynein light chain